MPAARTDWTVDMLDALPDDGKRYEIIDGGLFVTPAPSDTHQLVVLALASRLRSYLRPSSIARVLHSPADVRRADRRRNRVQTDVFVIRLFDGRRPPYPFNVSDLLLAAEVESPSNRLYDYQTKRRFYSQSGIPEYWIVSAEARTFARWRGSSDEADLLSSQLQWQSAGMSEPLVVDIPEFFADALG